MYEHFLSIRLVQIKITQKKSMIRTILRARIGNKKKKLMLLNWIERLILFYKIEMYAIKLNSNSVLIDSKETLFYF